MKAAWRLRSSAAAARDSLEARARNLGIELLFQGAADKLAAFSELLGRCGTGAEACAYVGDDLVDLPVMKRCGLAVAVPDAPALVRRQAQYVTRARGGHGAAREILRDHPARAGLPGGAAGRLRGQMSGGDATMTAGEHS